ncbi:MAG: shikimate kinase [Actinomycetaceae bacterium]|nr:shikimate kinase [Actinomycetaceae bacterium]
MPGIVILGVSGAGKSAVAVELGALTGLEVVESVDLVEKNTGVDASTLLVREGESAFENACQIAAMEALETDGIVVLSAGIARSAIVLERLIDLKSQGILLVELYADLATLMRRTGLNAPRAVGLGPTRRMLSALVDEYREQYARCEPMTIDTSLMRAQHVAERIFAHIDTNAVS